MMKYEVDARVDALIADIGQRRKNLYGAFCLIRLYVMHKGIRRYSGGLSGFLRSVEGLIGENTFYSLGTAREFFEVFDKVGIIKRLGHAIYFHPTVFPVPEGPQKDVAIEGWLGRFGTLDLYDEEFDRTLNLTQEEI
jgi:hypothetical protein